MKEEGQYLFPPHQSHSIPNAQRGSTMSTDQGFRRALAVHPNDIQTRLVYADWLDDQSDPRGEFLRLEIELSMLAPDDVRRWSIEERLRELQATFEPGWLAALDRTSIENCQWRFAFQCPRRWEDLLVMHQETVRFCEACKKNVYHCKTVEYARELAAQGKCVAVDSRLLRTEDDLRVTLSGVPSGGLVLGMLASEPAAPPFEIEHAVHVRSGLFSGMTGTVQSINARRQTAVVLLTIFCRPVSVEINLSDLEPASDSGE
jgi:uncharacterized protein (TIGR02996 family)